jgi:small subunit ribosomal protein S16
LLVIRLSRKGRRNHPMYRLLVAEHSKPTDGNFVEIVGNYNPTAKDQSLTVNKERVQYWISKGAQPSNSVSKLLNRTGFDLPVEERHGKPKKEAPVEPKAEEAPAVEETPAPVVEEAPAVEETPAEPEAPAPAPETDSGKEA